MTKIKTVYILSFAATFASCSGVFKTGEPQMRTGFYFVTDKEDGIEKKIERSNEVYKIEKKPFASVQNVSSTELKEIKVKDGIYTELCMTFDEKGSKDIRLGTGNIDHPKLAVIIDNKLLYVVDNTTQIKTGVMCVGLVDYSKEEINAAKQAVDEKK
jgi:hypothetical protein